ncbi:SDR family oxidoreductase [Alcaligenes parafaecalis]|uniref:SDR family oxidoreductase n=1 Tax=Alcaligenes parafaecalis TaxID=171260 RepID=A0ABT3VP85_9BURK|nr:SDR family oxidoreductase [Alcaligenes parafaecalis]MCX5465347.1 SDR family oxidoreductase [Alcaligenes parafaecalis]
MQADQGLGFSSDMLAGRVAIVTGGSSGIGLETVRILAQSGAAVAFCGRNAQRLAAARDLLEQAVPHVQLYTQVCDVLDEQQVNQFAQASQETLGAASILVNNAGQGRVSTFASTSDEDWRAELDLKFFSVLNPTRAYLPQLRAQRVVHGDAAIVCVNSLLARQPEPHMVATSAARAGLLSLVRSMATEFAPDGLRVNSILIGLVESGQWRRRFDGREDAGLSWGQWSTQLACNKQIPLARLGKPHEAANAIVFLSSPLASYTTGSFIDISGGLSRHA